MSIIIGIDPGTIIMGFGVIKVEDKKISLVEMGVLKLAKHKDHYRRLHYIFEKVSALVQIYTPEIVALEAPFYGKNVQSMLKLGRAQGVAIAAAMSHGSLTVEYAPKKVKQAITGNGNASKEQVWKMLQSILKFDDKPEFLDATDAVSVALCYHFESRNIVKQSSIPKRKSKNSWDQFIKDNPQLIKK